MKGNFDYLFDPALHRIVEKYMFANKLHRSYLERELKKTGVFRSQHQLLMYIARNPNASQKDIAKINHVSTATIAVSLKKLEKGGYIKRTIDKEDNRFNQISITDKGMEIVKSSVYIFKRAEDRMFHGFSQEDLEQFCR